MHGIGKQFDPRSGCGPPLHPRLKAPRPLLPKTFGLFIGIRRTHVHAHVATYLVRAEAIRPLTGAQAAGAEPEQGQFVADVFTAFFRGGRPKGATNDPFDPPDSVELKDEEYVKIYDAEQPQIWTDLSIFTDPGEKVNIIELERDIDAHLNPGPPPAPVSTTTGETCPATVLAGGTIAGSGTVNGGPGDETITITTTNDGTTSSESVTASSTGAFTFSVPAPTAGTYALTSAYGGTAGYAASTSTACTVLATAPAPPTPAATMLTLNCNGVNDGSMGNTVDVSGQLTSASGPLAMAPLSFTYTDAAGGTATATATTDSSGFYAVGLRRLTLPYSTAVHYQQRIAGHVTPR